jgi:class 3 adenylate cyclase
LIVDDEGENRRSLKRFLDDADVEWDVSTAGSALEALEAIAQVEFDVIITDLVMESDQSGIHVLQAAKQKDPLAAVILLTAFERKLDRYEAFRQGAFDCIQKNTTNVIAADEVLVKTRAAVELRRATLEAIHARERILFLSRYFDPGVFSTIENNPQLLDMSLRTVTICFWDIRGFSRVCDILKGHAAEIRSFLQDYFDAAAHVLFERNGVLDKFLGDGVMGIFGALDPSDDVVSARSAVDAAVDLKEWFDKDLPARLSRWRKLVPHEISMGLGCGIHTGTALVGNVGSSRREEFTALGSDVNFAQRIQARAISGQILVSASTRERLSNLYSVEDQGIADDLKNVAGEFRIFSVSR